MWIKICGIRDVEAASEVGRLGASAIGLNFYAKSPRAVSVETAAAIVSQLPAHVEPVGLFVNHPPADILAAWEACAFPMIQFHGDEPPEMLAEVARAIPSVRFIRAFRYGPKGLVPLVRYLETCRDLGVELFGCLIDADVPGSYGGTGQTVCWERLRAEYPQEGWPRLILAGGLRPDNVGQAIRTVRPWGVDTASGVESAPGCKDLSLVRRFLDEARAAFQSLSES